MPERGLLTTKGHFQRPHPTHLQDRVLLFRLQFCSRWSFTFELCVGHHLLQPAQQVGMESGRCTVWEKETGDRMKVLKMGLGDSRPLGSRALLLGAESHLFSFLASRKYLLCYDRVSLLCPRHVSRFTDYFKLSLLFSCTRATTWLEVIDPHMPWGNILVCAQAAFWTCADPAFQGPLYIFP